LKQAEIDTPLEDPVTVSAPLNGLSCVTNHLLFLSGWSSDEICFHHLLSRRSAEDTCEENLRRVSGRTNCCWHSHIIFLPGSVPLCTLARRPHLKDAKWLLV
jgi:hypothetical protein